MNCFGASKQRSGWLKLFFLKFLRVLCVSHGSSMKTEFLNFISQKKLCTANDKILLAVSGGIDSMVMLHLFRECNFNVSVAHANFQLRGSESDSDELFLKKHC